MLRNLRMIFTIALFAFIANQAEAQCFSYARGMCKSELKEFVHDGNYNATILSEGETAEIYKTFFSGQEYRVVVCKVDSLPPVNFKVIDGEDNILFDSEKQGGANVWDFKVESTQQLIIHVEVSEKDKNSKEKTAGCVSILFGIKRD